MAAPFETDLKIHYDLQGSGPPLVMIGGWPPGRRSWQPQLEAFTKKYTCLTMDWPGQGGSPKSENAFTTKDMARTLIRILDDIGWSNAHVVSSAVGGGVAQWLSIMAPERVRSLGLQSSWGRFDIFNHAHADFQRELLKIDAELWRKNTVLWLHPPSYHIKTDGEYLKPQLAKELFPEDLNIIHKLLDCTSGHNALDEVHLIQAPTLITVGGEDYITRFELSRQLWERIPGAELHVFPGLGHGMRHEDPEKYTKITLNWLEELDKKMEHSQAAN